MLTLIVSLLAAYYVCAFTAAFITLATAPLFERRIHINHAPKTIIQAKAATATHVPFFLYDLPSAVEEKRIQFDVLRHYHV